MRFLNKIFLTVFLILIGASSYAVDSVASDTQKKEPNITITDFDTRASEYLTKRVQKVCVGKVNKYFKKQLLWAAHVAMGIPNPRGEYWIQWRNIKCYYEDREEGCPENRKDYKWLIFDVYADFDC